MSPHAPPHLKEIAPVLMAGEDVRWMASPNIALLFLLEAIVAAGSFVVLMVAFLIFAADLSMTMKWSFAIIAALLGVGILHWTIGTRRYVITDQRLLVITGFAHDVHDSCELSDIASARMPRFTNSLVVERKSGKPIRLWALSNSKGALEALGIDASPDGADQAEPTEAAEPENPLE